MKLRLTPILLVLIICSSPAFSQNDSITSKPADLGCDSVFLSLIPESNNYKTVMLQWKCKLSDHANFFTIERSINGKEYDVIAVIKRSAAKSVFDFTDEMPSKLKNYYRIRTLSDEGRSVYSNIVALGMSSDIFCKFYPNPVEKLLIVRTESPVELKITDAVNKVRINKQMGTGLELLDVSSLEKGIYIISLFQKDSNKMMTDKLIKN
jgi:hypothetical protein